MPGRKERMVKLRCLVDELSDRDRQLKNDANMFEDFFVNFPIPVTMWSLDEHGNIISKRGNTVVNDDATELENMFLEEYSTDFKDAHKKAYAGSAVGFFSILPDKTYYTRLVPRGSSQCVIGVTGISWDITSNYAIINVLDEIKLLTADSSGTLDKIHGLTTQALEASRVKKLIFSESE